MGKSVHVDDWLAELAIIASSDIHLRDTRREPWNILYKEGDGIMGFLFPY